MRLSDVLNEASIAVGLHGHDKWNVIEQLTDLLIESGQAEPGWRDLILNGLIEREKQSSTGMQDGFAIPHCRMDDPIQNTLLSLAVLHEGMDFDAIDQQPTHLVICLVTPRKQNREHLKILAGIAQMFASSTFRASLQNADNPAEVISAVRRQEEALGA